MSGTAKSGTADATPAPPDSVSEHGMTGESPRHPPDPSTVSTKSTVSSVSDAGVREVQPSTVSSGGGRRGESSPRHSGESRNPEGDGGGKTSPIAELLELNEEQRRVFESPARRRAVSAGAGTGKTRLLVACCLAELEAGASVDSIVAITFTENAAAELRKRLEDAAGRYVERFGERGGINRKTAAGIRGARIGTIHGLAMGIVRENLALTPFSAGFEIGEPAQLRDDRERAVLETILKLRGDGDFDRLLETEFFNLDTLLKNISEIMEAAARKHLTPPFEAPEIGAAAPPSPLDSVSEHGMTGESPRHPPDPSTVSTKSTVSTRTHTDAHGHTRTNPAGAGAVAAAITASKPAFSTAAAKKRLEKAAGLAHGGQCRDFVLTAAEMDGIIKMKSATPEEKSAAENISRLALAEADRLNLQLTRPYLKAAGVAIKRYAEIKAENGRAEYEDLLMCALDILENRPARERYGKLFKLVVVDEFQDTDPAQNRIINLLCEGGAKMLVVGDYLQSIYGFRGAETELFLETLGSESFEAFRLPTNYRTGAKLLDFLNRFFENIVDGYPPMKPAGKSSGIFKALPARGKSADEKRRAEAEDIAREIGELAEAGRRYADIALIFRRRASMGVYKRALSLAGVPFTTGGGAAFFSLPEIRDMVSMLRFMAGPLDDTAQAAVLRSPFFGISDGGLVRYFREKTANKNGADFFRSPPEGKNEWEEAARYLAAIIRAGGKYDFSSPAAAARFAAYDLGYGAGAMGIPDGEKIRFNVIRFTEICAALAGKGVGTPEAVRRFDEGKNDPAPENTAEPENAVSRNSVSLLTAHGAKGLEFPVVFLADTDYRPPAAGGRVAANSSQIMVCHERCNAGIWREIAEGGSAEEEKRILYVALTRAGEAVFTRLHEKPPAGSFAGMVKTALEKMPDFCGGCGEPPPPPGIPATAEKTTAEPESATAETLRPLYQIEAEEEEKTPPFCGMAKNEEGEIIHRFFELWDFSPDSVKAAADFAAREKFFHGEKIINKITECAGNVLKSPLAGMVANARTVRKEYEFTVPAPTPLDSVSGHGMTGESPRHPPDPSAVSTGGRRRGETSHRHSGESRNPDGDGADKTASSSLRGVPQSPLDSVSEHGMTGESPRRLQADKMDGGFASAVSAKSASSKSGEPRGGKIDLLLETDGGIIIVDYKYTGGFEAGNYAEQMDFYSGAVEQIFGRKPARRYICVLPAAEMEEI